MALVDREAIAAAAERIRGRVHRTPLLSSRSLSERAGVPVFLKAECLQRGGAFKARGAFNKALGLSAEARSRGLLTYSSGNHGQAVALAARALGVPAVIVMPEDAPAGKRAACEGYGAEVALAGFTSDDRYARAKEIEAERGLTMMPPFDDAAIIAGQGTTGLEILEQLPEVANILVPIGGGGLVAGILAATRPRARVIGVEPTAACAMHRSLEAGEVTAMTPEPTIADGLKPVRPGQLTFEHARALGLETSLVDDAGIRAAMALLFERARLVVEPSGAATTAALLSGSLALEGPTVLVLSGGNVDPALMASVIAG